jgi:hypothetical protein
MLSHHYISVVVCYCRGCRHDHSDVKLLTNSIASVSLRFGMLTQLKDCQNALDIMDLYTASRDGHLSRVNQLLLQDEQVDTGFDVLIGVASNYGHLGVVDRLLQDERIDPAADDNKAIRMASRNGHLPVVDRLLQDARVDPAAQDNQAIRLASNYGYLSVVNRLLQDRRVDPSALHQQAVRWASQNDYFSVVNRLLEDERIDVAILHSNFSTAHYEQTAAMLSPTALHHVRCSLRLPFPLRSCIAAWEPGLRQYRRELLAFLDGMDSAEAWRWHRGALCRDVVEYVVSPYLVGMTRREYRELDTTTTTTTTTTTNTTATTSVPAPTCDVVDDGGESDE